MRKVEIKLSAGEILYTENLKDSTQNLLKLINEFSKVAGLKKNQYMKISCISIK